MDFYKEIVGGVLRRIPTEHLFACSRPSTPFPSISQQVSVGAQGNQPHKTPEIIHRINKLIFDY